MSTPPAKLIINKRDDSAVLIARLVACLPAATFEMETLCRLAGIKVSRQIPSAAVECVFRPRLLLNPDFVEKYCLRDEHLFLLVMHELWHIILAHTNLYPRATLANNIAFDAIINAGLAHQFREPEYRGFFEELNAADEFPGCLLRPPEGWPANPQYPDVGPPGTRAILERLYPPAPSRKRVAVPLYEEILNLLRDYIKEKIANGEVIIEPMLIGDHDDPSRDAQALDDPFMKEVIRRVSSSWPPPPFAISRQRGLGSSRSDWFSTIGPSTEETRRAFSRVLQRTLGPQRGNQRRRARSPIPGMSGTHVMPNPRDRLASARQVLGVQGVLWGQPGVVTARMPERPSRTNIYLDVSGSMNQVLPYLIGLLLPYVAKGQAAVFQFSTVVEPLPFDQL
ncbi:MAG: hypothetical protein GYB67_15940, partial [Chloroflexi bacterium]|nr:hypothetical protein [Chloroflexota bacterium]